MAWHNKVYDEKKHTGNLQVGHSKMMVVNVSSPRDKVDELWSMLRYDALLDESVDSNLGLKGAKTKAQREHIKSEVSAYIDQAENFYQYARNSDYRSSALLYYYAFLNLSKAYIVLNKPNLVNKKFIHGISRKTTSGKLINRSFEVRQSSGNSVSVFNELYNLEYDAYLPKNRPISFEHIFGYSTDISNETSKLIKGSSRKVHPSRLFVFTNKDTKKCWTVIAAHHGFYPANYKSTFATFEKMFHRFNPGVITREYSLKMQNNEAQNYSFSQSVKEYDVLPTGSLATWETKNHIEDSIGDHYQDNIHDDSASFSITDPLGKIGKSLLMSLCRYTQ